MSPFEYDCVRVLDILVASRACGSISVSSPLARPYTSGPARHHSTARLHLLLFVVCPSLRHLSPPTPAPLPHMLRARLRRVLLSVLPMNAHLANPYASALSVSILRPICSAASPLDSPVPRGFCAPRAEERTAVHLFRFNVQAAHPSPVPGPVRVLTFRITPQHSSGLRDSHSFIFRPSALISSHAEYCIPVPRYPIQMYLTLLTRPASLAASIPALPSPGVFAHNQRSRIRVVRPIHNQYDYPLKAVPAVCPSKNICDPSLECNDNIHLSCGARRRGAGPLAATCRCSDNGQAAMSLFKAKSGIQDFIPLQMILRRTL
ncbi:hypothetical protein DFH09DRAFT_1320111 [Mycena vulgaris]|nr:hypothetical protein DFH09DRAFT_1320111 [Mycena vulgaris]